jgi:hypothetical protein
MAQRDGVEQEQDRAIQQRIQTEVLNAERAAVIRLRDQDRLMMTSCGRLSGNWTWKTSACAEHNR